MHELDSQRPPQIQRHSSGSERSLEDPPVILIGLMGVTGSGKSNFAKMTSNDQEIVVGRKLNSCTKTVRASDTFEVDGHMVQLVDTPGFNDDELSDAQVLELIATWMKESFEAQQTLHGIMYLQRITDTRLDGGAVRSLMLFGDICGPDFLQNTVMLTTMWDKGRDPTDIEENEETERELKEVHWKSLMDSGAMYSRSYNRKEACKDIVDLIVQKQPKMPKLQEEVGRNKLAVGETGAGAYLMGELRAEMERMTKAYQERSKKLEEKYVKLLEENKAETAKALEREREAWEAKLEKFKRDQELLGSWRGRKKAEKLEREPIDRNQGRKKRGMGRFLAGLGFRS